MIALLTVMIPVLRPMRNGVLDCSISNNSRNKSQTYYKQSKKKLNSNFYTHHKTFMSESTHGQKLKLMYFLNSNLYNVILSRY